MADWWRSPGKSEAPKISEKIYGVERSKFVEAGPSLEKLGDAVRDGNFDPPIVDYYFHRIALLRKADKLYRDDENRQKLSIQKEALLLEIKERSEQLASQVASGESQAQDRVSEVRAAKENENLPARLDLAAFPIIAERAREVIGEGALRWFGTPVAALGYATPISLLGTTEGIASVSDLLTQVEHGVW